MNIIKYSLIIAILVNCFGCATNHKVVTRGTTSLTASTNSATTGHWKVALCTSSATPVTFQAGPSKDDNDVFLTWHQGDGAHWYWLPDRCQNLEKVYMKVTSPEDAQIEVCLFYDDHPKKRYGFNGGVEDHDVSASDDDDNDCHCRVQ